MSRGSLGGSVTPEAVRLRTDAAGLGSRSIALMVDALIQLVVLVPVLVGFLVGGLSGTAETVVFAIVVFVVVWGYFPLFEWLRGGQTPGKRMQGIRVVQTSGEPAGFAPVMVRNLLRIVEVYALPFIALIAMFVSPRGQRLGDLAAGTMVVRDRKLPRPATMAMTPLDSGVPALDTSGLTEREYTVLRTFLARRSSLDPAARRQLAASLAATLRRQLGGVPPTHADLADETLIQAAVRSYRSRYASWTDGP
jgi:uncharacterized RDD family membrane protein YckC